jgi:hypothetical protein
VAGIPAARIAEKNIRPVNELSSWPGAPHVGRRPRR